MRKILLAEDDRNFGHVLKSELEDEGYSVDLCSDGVETLLNFIDRRTDYDFAILDIKMPKLDGINTLRILKKLKKELPVITISGNAGTAEMSEALQAGSSQCLAKPFAISRLKETLQSLAEGKAPERQSW